MTSTHPSHVTDDPPSTDTHDSHTSMNFMGERNTTMTRYLKSFLQLSVTLLVMAGFAAVPAVGQDQYVDPVNGNNSNSGNTAGDPVETIQQALTNAPTNGVIAIRRNQEYDENPSFSVGPYTFTSWDGEDGSSDLDGDGDSGEETGTDAPGAAVLNGDLTIGDASTSTSTLFLAEGFTLTFEENRVLTLTGEPGGPGSAIQGPGTLEATTSSGQFIVNIVNDGGNQSVTATVQNFTLDKSGGTFRVRRSPQDTGNETAELQFTNISETGGGGPNFVVDAGSVEIEDRSDISFRARSDDDSDPTLDLSDASVTSPGSRSGLILDISGDEAGSASDSEVFIAQGNIDLGLLLRIEDTPEVSGTGSGTVFNNPAGLVVEFNEIGNGGRSGFNTADDISGADVQDQVQFENLTDIVGSFRARSTANDGLVDAPLLSSVTDDVDIGSGAAMRIGSDDADPLTVEGETIVQGGDDTTSPTSPEDELIVNNPKSLNDTSPTFEGTVTVEGGETDATFYSLLTVFDSNFTVTESSGEAVANFFGAASFQDVTLGSRLNFFAPGIVGASTINGTLALNGDATIFQEDDTGNDNGRHDLNLKGDVDVATNTLTFDLGDDAATGNGSDGNGARIAFNGSSSQEVLGSDGAIVGADRVEIDNPNTLELTAAENSDFRLEVLDILRLTDGDFFTNGGLDMRLDAFPVGPAPEVNALTTTAKRTLVVNANGSNRGDLVTGNSSSLFSGENVAYYVRSASPSYGGRTDGSDRIAETPYRIRYIGNENADTGAEFLPNGVDPELRTLPEFEIAMTEDAADVSLSPSAAQDNLAYRIASPRTGRSPRTADSDARLELLGGDLAFTEPGTSDLGQLGLECRGTIERGSTEGAIGEFNGGPVDPVRGMTFAYNCDGSDSFAGGTDFVNGIEGYNVQYTNSAPIDGDVESRPGDLDGQVRGIEWLTRSQQQNTPGREPEEVLDVHVAGEGTVQLFQGSTYQFNQNMRLNDGSTLDLNGNTLRMQTFNEAPGFNVGGIIEDLAVSENSINPTPGGTYPAETAPGNTLRIAGSGQFGSTSSSELHFRGAGQANVIADALDSGLDLQVTLPKVLIQKQPVSAETGTNLADPDVIDRLENTNSQRSPSTNVEAGGGDRRVYFATAGTTSGFFSETVDGYFIDGDFEIVNAQHFADVGGLSSTILFQDGVEVAGADAAAASDARLTDRVDVFDVRGDFIQGTEATPASSFLAFSYEQGIEESRFTVTGSLTKNATDSSRHHVGQIPGTGVITPQDARASVATYSVGTVGGGTDSLTQENGTFNVFASSGFEVKGGVRNSSPDDQAVSDGLFGPTIYASNAFQVTGLPEGDVDDITPDGDLGVGDFDAYASITGDVIQRLGTMSWNNFIGQSGLVEIGSATRLDAPPQPSDFVQDNPFPARLTGAANTTIPIATTVNVRDSVQVLGGEFDGNLFFPFQGIAADDFNRIEYDVTPTGDTVNIDTIDVAIDPDTGPAVTRDQSFEAAAVVTGNDVQDLPPVFVPLFGNAPEAIFDVSTLTQSLSQKLVAKEEFANSNPGTYADSVASPTDPTLDRQVVIGGENTLSYEETDAVTRIEEDAQLRLDGHEWEQYAGGFTFLGDGDVPAGVQNFNILEAFIAGNASLFLGFFLIDDRTDFEEGAVFGDSFNLDIYGLEERSNHGLVGTVRFGGEELQTVRTDESSGTFFHGLAVSAQNNGDGIELASNVSTNTLRGGQGIFPEGTRGVTVGPTSKTDGSDHGVQRPFGTLVLQEGNVRTQDDTLSILAPVPTSGGDLVVANNADEFRDGNPVPASPVLGGDNDSKVVGNMRRAVEDPGTDTGGFIEDGYIFPMGTVGEEPRYRGFVLEAVTAHTDAQFYTVSLLDDVNKDLPEDLTDRAIRNGEADTLDLNAASLPFYKVSYDQQEGFNNFNVRIISDIAGVNEVKQLRILQAEEGATQWNDVVAGGASGYDETAGSPIDDDSDVSGGPNASINGVSNVIHEGVDLRKGTIFGLASQEDINPIGQTDVPVITLSSGSPVSVDVGNSVNISFDASDTDSELTADNFSVAPGTNSEIDPNNVSFQDDGTVTYSPDSSAAKASFVTSSQSFSALDLEVQVEDADGNTATASVGVEVGLQDGDADMDGLVGSPDGNAAEAAQDAELALTEYLEGADISTPDVLADVAFYDGADIAPSGGDGRVTPFDAAQILALAFGSNPAIASKDAAANGGEIIVDGAENGAVSIRLSDDASDVYSAAVDLKFDPTKATVSDVSTDLPDGWIVDHVSREDGTLRIGLAGSTPLSGGAELATVRTGGSKSSTGSLEPEGTFRLNGSDASDVRVDIAPDKFALEGNYPNPFSESTTIKYQLSESTEVTLEVYDMLGRKVSTLVNERQSAGSYEVTLDQSSASQELGSGIYIYRIKAGDFQDTGKMTVVK